MREESTIRTHEEAWAGSQMLREQLEKLFRKWEHEHGFRPGAGVLLVPNGYDPSTSGAGE